MRSEPTIRPIRADEAPEAKRLIYRIVHPLMEPQMTLDEFIRQWEEGKFLSDLDDIQTNYLNSESAFLVVEIEGCLVGTGAFQRYIACHLFSADGPLRSPDESLRTGKGVCMLRRFTLLPSYQGHKLGHLAYALMLGLIERARDIGYTRMALWTNPIKLHRAVDFYHRLGFRDIPVDGTGDDELWMGKDI